MIAKKTFFISCVCLLVSLPIVWKFWLEKGRVGIVATNLEKLPIEIGNFKSIDVSIPLSVVKELNTDIYVSRNYLDDHSHVINLYIGYYGTRKGGRTGHRPTACYPSQGFAIIRENPVEIVASLDGKPRRITVTRLLVSNGHEQQIVYHWYQSSASSVLSNGIELNLNRFKNLILYRRNDGAFVRVSMGVSHVNKYSDALLREFIKKIFPVIARNWPVEKNRSR